MIHKYLNAGVIANGKFEGTEIGMPQGGPLSPFDNIDHELLMKVVERHVGEPWICMYIKRWLKTPFITRDGQVIETISSFPQFLQLG